MSSRQLHLIQSLHEMATRCSYGHGHGLSFCACFFAKSILYFWPQGKNLQFYSPELLYHEPIQAWRCLPLLIAECTWQRRGSLELFD